MQDQEIDKDIEDSGKAWKVPVSEVNIPPPSITQNPLENPMDVQDIHSLDHEEEDKDNEDKSDEDKSDEENNEVEKNHIEQ